ncbi:unnamed protein product [Allacma fusca]|uniref:Uncharacterized protein n=1 Tax=Allacma fusca TaxID=39272 RepID=A0A8J2J2C3_9HEXA|nr:unnamed protein product [Allacma fusca]
MGLNSTSSCQFASQNCIRSAGAKCRSLHVQKRCDRILHKTVSHIHSKAFISKFHLRKLHHKFQQSLGGCCKTHNR